MVEPAANNENAAHWRKRLFPWLNSNKKSASPSLDLRFEGFGNLYDFVAKQIKGWENLPEELKNSKSYFESIKKELIVF